MIMPLKNYSQKRDFKKTPEPKPKKSRGNGHLEFVIQEHHASHLHYDFRLEHHGVLKSWAVPKGLPADTSAKRLAIEVEDHPFSYRTFEGTIPKGNYGAGTVEIWDKGTYYVDPDLDKKGNEEKIEHDLKKGHLNVYLQGRRARGKFTLVKMRSRKKNEWLLLKKNDERVIVPADEASEEQGIKAPMPLSVSPMLATLVDEPFDRKGWIFEVKWDGYRIISQVEKGKVRLYTRNNNTYTDHFPSIAQELKKLPFHAVFDGEVVALDEQGRGSFQRLQNYLNHQQERLAYYIFDILYLNQYDLRRLPLSKRKDILKRILPQNALLRLSDYIHDQGKSFFNAAKKAGLEGVIAKRLDSVYLSAKRSHDWLKIKAVREQEAIICGFTEPAGSRKYLGALVLGVYKGKELVYIGHSGGGFNHASLKDMHQRLTPLITSKCPFKKKPKTNTPATWVIPKLMCAVKFQEWTNDGSMRQPIFIGLREDKRPLEVKQEVAQPVKKAVSPDGTALGSIGSKVQLTHLDKIYWPKEGYTKGDMVRYYQEVADYILPYIKGRPQSLHRHPNGIEEAGFFHKDITHKPPAFIKTVKIKSDDSDKVVNYMLCDSRQALAYINNLGCIEINTWMSSAAHPQHPDFLVLDFDPVDVDFVKVIDVVIEARKILDKSKLKGFVKTSGSRGMHVFIPLYHQYNFDQIKDFAHYLCMVIHNKMPDITSLERHPSKRKGLVYLDYLQNHYTATMAMPYSLRPKPMAPVSIPLEWKEVTRSLTITDYNIKTTAARLKKKGDVWKAIFTTKNDIRKSLLLLEKL